MKPDSPLSKGWIIAGTQRYAVLDLLCRYTVLRLQDASTPDDDSVPSTRSATLPPARR